MPLRSPMNRRARWNQRLMSGVTAGITTLPNWFATYAVGAYAVALLGVNMIYSSYAMEWYFWLFGIAWVVGFFFLSVKFSQDWSIRYIRSEKNFERMLFRIGLLIRILYSVFIYLFYIQMTGAPHEFSTADSSEYIVTAQWFLEESRSALGDLGYPLFLLIPVALIDGDGVVLLVLLIQAFFGSYTSVLIYRLTGRSIDESTARMAGIFCMLHPVLICYVGLTLKEVIMTFIVVVFINLADRMMRDRKFTFAAIAPMVLVGLSLFLFRTVLGMIAFMALFFALLMMDRKIVSWGKKLTFGVLIAGILLFSVSDNIMRDIQKITDTDVKEQQEISMTKRYGGEKRGKLSGNAFAKYASTAVFAPLIFTIPFPTMVDVGSQEDMRLIHGGNWMRNVMSGFVILAMIMLLLNGEWRKYTLPLAMLLGYLLMLAFTQFAHSLRFHIPVMPFEMMFAAYAIVNMRKKHRNWYMIWCLLCIVMCFGWNWFKLAGRGLA